LGLSVAAVEKLYRARFGEFVRVASAIAGGEAAGTDVVQESFARALRSRSSYRGEAPLEAWLWRIVINTARTTASVGRRTAESDGHLELVAAADIASGADSAIRGKIAALPERQREVIFLRSFADLDYRSIADALDVEVGTVSATLNAAHRALRKTMEVQP